MARINPALLDRLCTKLAISKAQVYNRIQQVANRTLLDRSKAALVLAAENSINIHKYSTDGQREEIRRARGTGSQSEQPESLDRALPRPSRKTGDRRTRAPKAKDNSVFVVHGRNDKLTSAMYDFLRSLGLKPLEWEKVVLLTKKTNPYVGEILDIAMAKVQAVLVMLTPDDQAMLDPKLLKRSDSAREKKLSGQPRPNVLFEAGLALGRHPEKTLLVEIGSLRKFSDIAGKHMVRLNGEYAARNDLANRLEALGCKVDRKGTHWTKTGDFRV